MTTEQRLNEARAAAATLDRMTRQPKRILATAPWIIPATMILVTLFAVICFAIRLIINYLNSRNSKSKNYGLSEASSPDLPTTPEDQTSMATTASMKTRSSLRNSSKRRKNKPPPVSLYQIKQMQSPGSISSNKSKTHKAAMKAVSRAAKAEANRSLSRDSTRQIDDASDDSNKNDADSPTNLSQQFDEVDEIQASIHQSGIVYGAANTRMDEPDTSLHQPNQPEVHIVHIRDIDDNSQQPPADWPQAESEI